MMPSISPHVVPPEPLEKSGANAQRVIEGEYIERPSEAEGSLASTPAAALVSVIESNPGRFGGVSSAQLTVGLVRTLDDQLNVANARNGSLAPKVDLVSEEKAELSTKVAVLTERSKNESRLAILRKGVLTVGLALIGLGWKELANPLGIPLIIAGSILAVTGWYSRSKDGE